MLNKVEENGVSTIHNIIWTRSLSKYEDPTSKTPFRALSVGAAIQHEQYLHI